MSQGFIKLNRASAVELLEGDPQAFLLLTQIALRARHTNGEYSRIPLKANQAFLGDHTKAGLTRQQYRATQKRLERYGLATFKSTNKGTIATLISTAVYDINAEQQISYSKPTNPSMKIEQFEPPENQAEAIKESADIQQKPTKEPITRKEECKNIKTAKKKEDLPLHHSPQHCKKPEDLADLRKKMISQGWTNEEFDEAWCRYLSEPQGHVKNVRKWLESVLQSIRDSKAKKKHLQALAESESLEKAANTESERLAIEQAQREQMEMLQRNKEFMEQVNNTNTRKDLYQIIHEKAVKLYGGSWNGFLLSFDDPNFIEFVTGHLGIEPEEIRYE
jgi:hypothetical protein